MSSALPVFLTESPAAARIRERGGVPAVLALYEQHGGRAKDVALALGLGAVTFQRWLQAQSPDVQQHVAEIQRGRAAALAEETVAIADETREAIEDDPDAKAADRIKAAKEAIATRQWMAERLDRERWAPKVPETQVTVNLATLHLDALRRRFKGVAGDPAEIPADATAVSLDDLL